MLLGARCDSYCSSASRNGFGVEAFITRHLPSSRWRHEVIAAAAANIVILTELAYKSAVAKRESIRMQLLRMP